MRRSSLGAGAMMAILALLPLSAGANEKYPSRPIRMVVPFPAGGATDVVARVVADRLGTALGQRVLVENKGGAGGNIGAADAAKSPPDGYTILFSASGPLSANKVLYALPYDPETDFEPVSLVAKVPNIIVVNLKIPATNVGEFVAYLRSRPGQVDYSSIGNGSSQHLSGVLFDLKMGTKMRHIPYRSTGQIIVDLLSGDVPVSFQLIPNVMAQIGDRSIRALGVMSSERSPSLPGVPTMAEQGFPELDSTGWFGVLLPKGSPKAIVDLLNAELVRIVRDPANQARFIEVGADPAFSSPAELKALIAAEVVKWGALIRAAGVKAD